MVLVNHVEDCYYAAVERIEAERELDRAEKLRLAEERRREREAERLR